jgi:uncharacterized membrane protein YkvA (DUF1232 family)
MRPWIVVLLAVLVVWIVAVVALVVAGRRVAARELATLVPNLVILFKGLFGDDRVPVGSKILLGVAIVWLVSPIDLVPEFIPLLGPLDDAVVAALVLRHLMKHAGEDVVREHWRGEPRTLDLVMRFGGVRQRRQA